MAELLNLNRLVYFTTVAELASFTAAGDHLGVAKAVVSHQVRKLEEELGVTLMRRTTRRVTLTEEGRLFYGRAVAILQDAETAFGEISVSAAEPSGTLRLTAPIDYGMTVLAPVIADYLRKYPQMRVDANFDDSVTDLVAENIDLAIRVGWLTDSSNKARRLGTIQQYVVASPDFMASVPADISPHDAKTLPWVTNKQLRGISQWTFTKGGETVKTELNSVVLCDQALPMQSCLREGTGLGILPDSMVAQDIADGRLVRVFPDWSLPEAGIHAVYPPARYRPAKVQAFVTLLLEAEKKRARELSPLMKQKAPPAS